jgi:asparagine synthase (glutamine-hydrolysing)
MTGKPGRGSVFFKKRILFTMCGICGFNWSEAALGERCAQAIAHRGPDQSGVYAADGITLGHRRLSIIDLSEQGRQPMTNEDGSIFLVFNGEIYNFPELRATLQQKGHVFRSQSDSEVILHGYEEWGDQCLQRFRGMFALALWDAPQGRLLIARDRLGIKPLYYYYQNGKFAFASEIKALLAIPGIPRAVNLQAFYDYLGYEFVPSPQTMFDGIHKLPPGYYLEFSERGPAVHSYWDVAFARGEWASPHEAVEELRALLRDTVRMHLISDVPLGVFLSGGLDSSTLVALMRSLGVDPLRTFSIGYPDPSFGELPYARIVADKFETEHTVLMIPEVTIPDLEAAVWHLDEPMTDLSALPLYLVCREAKKHVTVCLSGEGGDEIFVGYDRFRASKFDTYYRRLPEWLREQLIYRAVQHLPDQPQKKGALNIVKRFVEGSRLPVAGEHLRWQYFISPDWKDRLFKENFKARVEREPFRLVQAALERCPSQDRLDREIYLDLRFVMPDSVLMKVDKMSMAHALEIRVPFLDHRVVEFAAGLPGSWKLKGFETKAIFRQALKGWLPDSIVNRGKQGYSLPIKNLLREGLKDYMVSLLNESPLVREQLDTAFLNRLIREHLDRVQNHNHLLWALINAAIWHRKFIE